MTPNLKELLKKPYDEFKYAQQRMERGFSDRDMWNADAYLAGMFANILRWYASDLSHGVPMHYGDGLPVDPTTKSPDVNEMVKIRNAEYLKYAALFEEYAKNGVAFGEEWKKDVGGLTEEEIREAMLWFATIFTELWD